jgi:hypothetical protein
MSTFSQIPDPDRHVRMRDHSRRSSAIRFDSADHGYGDALKPTSISISISLKSKQK